MSNKPLSQKQKAIAKVAGNKNKIEAIDFKNLKKKKVNIGKPKRGENKTPAFKTNRKANLYDPSMKINKKPTKRSY